MFIGWGKRSAKGCKTGFHPEALHGLPGQSNTHSNVGAADICYMAASGESGNKESIANFLVQVMLLCVLYYFRNNLWMTFEWYNIV